MVIILARRMTYFIETAKLLSEPSFIKLAQSAYEDFIMLDRDDYISRHSRGETFTFSVSRWLALAKTTEPRRFFSGGSGSFLLYMNYEVEGLIHKDWEDFKAAHQVKQKKEQQTMLANFVEEAEEVGRVSKNKQHLEPLQATIDSVLSSITAEYGEQANKPVKPTLNGQDINLEPMQWNGNTNVLATLFYDLSRKKLPNKRMALDATAEQMKAFILTCFVDKDGKPFSKATIDTYFQEDKPEKRARGKKKLDADALFEHEE